MHNASVGGKVSHQHHFWFLHEGSFISLQPQITNQLATRELEACSLGSGTHWNHLRKDEIQKVKQSRQGQSLEEPSNEAHNNCWLLCLAMDGDFIDYCISNECHPKFSTPGQHQQGEICQFGRSCQIAQAQFVQFPTYIP